MNSIFKFGFYSARLKLTRSVRMIKLPNVCRKLYCFNIFTVSGIWFYFEILKLSEKHFILCHSVIYTLFSLEIPIIFTALQCYHLHFMSIFYSKFSVGVFKINKSSRGITWAKTVKRLCKMDQKFLFELEFFFYTFLYPIVSKKC